MHLAYGFSLARNVCGVARKMLRAFSQRVLCRMEDERGVKIEILDWRLEISRIEKKTYGNITRKGRPKAPAKASIGTLESLDAVAVERAADAAVATR